MARLNILMYLESEFDGLKRRPFIEALATELSGLGGVLCVEPWHQGASAKSTIRRVTPNLRVLTPHLLSREPGVVHPDAPSALLEPVKERLREEIAGILGRQNHLITWFTSPRQVCLVGMMGEEHAVCERSEEFWSYAGHDQEAENRSRENQLVQSVDVVFAAAGELQSLRGVMADKGVFLPCGVDFAAFACHLGGSPEDMCDIPLPRIGHIGRLDDRSDIGLLREVVLSRPLWSFIHVGPVDSSIDRSVLADLPNFYQVGVKRYEDMPSYVRNFNVGMMIYKPRLHSNVGDPLKLYEYLASGVPVVSTRFAPLGEAADLVWFADTAEEFADCIDYSLLRSPVEQRWRGIELAQSRDWRQAASKAVDVVVQLAKSQRAAA